MKRWSQWLIGLLLVALLVALLGGFVVHRLQARKSGQAAASAPRADAALDLAASDVLGARTLDLGRTLEVSGGLRAVNSAFVKARVGADVQALTVREGDRVKAGQVLGRLDSAELDLKLHQAEQSAASTRAQLDIARRALENNRALVAQGFISATGLEASISNDAAAQATMASALAAVQLARKARADAVLIAPIGGMVSQRLVQPGERVAVDTKLLEIVDLSRLELEAAIAPEDIVALEIGHRATLQVDGIAQPVSARVVRINPSTQAGTRAVTAYLAVDGQPGLRQGLFARGTIELARQHVLALPLSAVRTDQAQPYVLQLLHGKALRTSVRLGVRGVIDGQPWVEIAGGLADGDQVLAAAAGPVPEGTPVRVSSAAVASAPAAPVAPAAR